MTMSCPEGPSASRGSRLARRVPGLALRLLAALIVAVVPLLVGGAAPAQAYHRWIDVDLGAKTATAFEGSKVVYTAEITAGKPGFETPTGTFYILKRVFNETMDSATTGIARSAPEGYYLPNVMYTQYFTWEGHALHGNYWVRDSVYGNANTSHGCVGMRNSDAAFFWDFADHGTPVVIHW